MKNKKIPLQQIATVVKFSHMNSGGSDWVTCSVSWVPSELKELKKFCAITDTGFSAYVRKLARNDRRRRARILAKIEAQKSKLKEAA